MSAVGLLFLFFFFIFADGLGDIAISVIGMRVENV